MRTTPAKKFFEANLSLLPNDSSTCMPEDEERRNLYAGLLAMALHQESLQRQLHQLESLLRDVANRVRHL
jgi:hypothetical protein